MEHILDDPVDEDDEAKWDALFAGTQSKLTDEAQRVRQEIADGKAESMDWDRL